MYISIYIYIYISELSHRNSLLSSLMEEQKFAVKNCTANMCLAWFQLTRVINQSGIFLAQNQILIIYYLSIYLFI